MNTRLDYIQQKIVDYNTALERIKVWRKESDKVVFTNGCFDILHAGHVLYLSMSADLGSRLIVALNTDDSIKRQGKGQNRPVNNEEARSMVLASIAYVDLVVLFNEDTPIEIIKYIQPNVLVKGSDYDANEKNELAKTYIVGSKEVRSLGGEIITIPLLKGYSTTSIIEKIKS